MPNSAANLPGPRHQGRLRYLLSYTRSLLFTNLLIYFFTAVCGTVSLLGSVFDAGGRWQHACARVWSWLILKTSGIRVRVEGLEHVHPGENAIYCANHQSAMDIPVLFVNLPAQFRFVAKRSLFNMPFMGWHLRRSGHIPVDRDRPREALKSMKKAAQEIREGKSVLLFPEGHRSRSGELQPFKSRQLLHRHPGGSADCAHHRERNVLRPNARHLSRARRPNRNDRPPGNRDQGTNSQRCR